MSLSISSLLERAAFNFNYFQYDHKTQIYTILLLLQSHYHIQKESVSRRKLLWEYVKQKQNVMWHLSVTVSVLQTAYSYTAKCSHKQRWGGMVIARPLLKEINKAPGKSEGMLLWLLDSLCWLKPFICCAIIINIIKITHFDDVCVLSMAQISSHCLI